MIPNSFIHIVFPSNQNLYDNYHLDINKHNITNVGQLRQAIAQRLYLRPTNINIICNRIYYLILEKPLTD